MSGLAVAGPHNHIFGQEEMQKLQFSTIAFIIVHSMAMSKLSILVADDSGHSASLEPPRLAVDAEVIGQPHTQILAATNRSLLQSLARLVVPRYK